MGIGSVLAGLDGVNYYLQSSQFSNILSYLHATPSVYLWLSILGFVTFLAHGRD